MAASIGEVHHLGCELELRYIAQLRLVEWQDDLPDSVAEFCADDEPRWFDATRVSVAFNRAVDAWQKGLIVGGQFGAEPIPAHPAKFQRRLGTIATTPEWHAWCSVELNAALGQLGMQFATEVRAYPEWADHCEGGIMLFGDVVWRANFVELATDLLLFPWPAPGWWAVHSPVYRTW